MNFLDQYLKQKQAYASARGVSAPTGKRNRSTGQLLVPPSKGVPNTTWADALVFWGELKRVADPTMDQCFVQAKKAGISPLFACTNLFVRTAAFQRAARDFEAQNPVLRGITPDKLVSNRLYPFNEELWGYADDYVIARNAAGEVKFPFEIAVESVVEAIKEAPGVIGDALQKMDPRNLVPAALWLRDMVKWGSIGGGLFLLYWYGLREK